MANFLQRIVTNGRAMGTQLGSLSRPFCASSGALVEAEIKPGEIGMVSGIPDEHLRRRVVIYSPARTATQQGAGKVGKWKINFVSTQKWKNPLMGCTSTGDPYANVGDSALYFDSEESAKSFAERHGWDYTVRKRHTPLLKTPKQTEKKEMAIAGNRNWYLGKLAGEIGNAVKKSATNREKGWYTSHMAAASRAIEERIPLVDFVVEVRDARIPLSSDYQLLRNCSSSPHRIVLLNKMDLANRSQLKDWIKYFEQPNCLSHSLNSHNKDNVKEFLNFLQSQIRKLKNIDNCAGHTITMMIVGIPNVGKSALCNSLHQIGRISAAEKGKLRHAKVTPHPGETKDITSLKIGSHPNIYVLDTPGILPPQILDAEICSKLALTGAIRECLAGEKELARYFLATLNLSDEYKKWAKLSTHGNDISYVEHKAVCSSEEMSDLKRKGITDHTQDYVVNNVRRILYETISSFDGQLQNEVDMEQLIEMQFSALEKVFEVPMKLGDEAHTVVATKLLNLYRTGRLGYYTLDPVTCASQDLSVL